VPQPVKVEVSENKELDKILDKVETKSIIEKENMKKKLEKLKAGKAVQPTTTNVQATAPPN
jgi:hypothetical protein